MFKNIAITIRSYLDFIIFAGSNIEEQGVKGVRGVKDSQGLLLTSSEAITSLTSEARRYLRN